MQKSPISHRMVLTCVLLAGATGCTHLDLQDAVIYDVAIPVDVQQTRSMGEPLVTKYACPCHELYEATSEIRFENYDKPAPKNSEWVARYVNPSSKEKYLLSLSSQVFHPALALVLLPSTMPTLSSDHAVIQIDGTKQGRTWSLSSPSQANELRLAGYIYSGETWRLQYIGPDKEHSDVLRFTIDDLRGRERVGQVEYAHDLRKGREFVVRGVRLRISDVSSDGLISYVVVADARREGS
jgi:hypothetical protein